MWTTSPNNISYKQIFISYALLTFLLTPISGFSANSNFLKVASDASIEMYLDRRSVSDRDSGFPSFNVVSNMKVGEDVNGEKAKSMVTGHFMDCEQGLIVTTWMELFTGTFGKGSYISQVPDMYETQGKNRMNRRLFDELCD